MATVSIDPGKLTCTCGVSFDKHKSGRCMDAILHRLLFQEEPRLAASGTLYIDGPREESLFEDDYLYTRDGNDYLLPRYTSDEGAAWQLMQRWSNLGGTAVINMNKTTWSANFHHSMLGYMYRWNHNYLTRAKLTWMVHRAMVPAAISFARVSGVDECLWIDGVESIVNGTP